MLRHVASKSARPSWTAHRRAPALTTRSFSIQEFIVEPCSSHAYAFHDLFQTLHDSAPATLSWPVSILLVTFATRTLSFPFRISRAKQDRDRRLVFPQLTLQSIIVERQGEVKLTAGKSTSEPVTQWQAKEFVRRREVLEKKYPHMRRSYIEWFGTRYGTGSLAAGLVALVNASTALAMAVDDPAIASLCDLGDAKILLAPCIASLVISNIAYYRSKIPLPPSTGYFRPKTGNVSMSVSFLRWTEDEAAIMLVYFFPIFGAAVLQLFPEPVMFAVLGNSLWTLLERRLVNAYVGMPPGCISREPRGAQQSTRPERSAR